MTFNQERVPISTEKRGEIIYLKVPTRRSILLCITISQGLKREKNLSFGMVVVIFEGSSKFCFEIGVGY